MSVLDDSLHHLRALDLQTLDADQVAQAIRDLDRAVEAARQVDHTRLSRAKRKEFVRVVNGLAYQGQRLKARKREIERGGVPLWRLREVSR